MIFTLTTNPSVDYFIVLDCLNEGELNITKSGSHKPGGKGINVSRVLSELGTENTAFGFIGGYTGDFIENYLKNEKVKTDFIKLEDTTRINVKIKSEKETEINGASPIITRNHLILLEKKLEKVKDGDFFVLSGSLSSALGDNFYSEIIEKISHKKVEIIVDTRGNALKATLKNNPFLIKPNHLELGELFGATVDSKEKAAFYGRKLLETGVKNIIISMGSKGAVFLNKNLQLFASPVEGNVISTIGAGDSVVAGFIHRYVETKNEKDSFRFGVSCGTVTAFSSDLCKKSDVNNMLNKIEIIDF